MLVLVILGLLLFFLRQLIVVCLVQFILMVKLNHLIKKYLSFAVETYALDVLPTDNIIAHVMKPLAIIFWVFGRVFIRYGQGNQIWSEHVVHECLFIAYFDKLERILQKD